MTLDQLRIFVAVAERRHVTKAAAALGMTQSAASAAIAALERRYGARLFDRVGRGIELTDTGHRFLPEARAVLDQMNAARSVLEDLSDPATGTVSIAASQTIASYWLPRRLTAYHTEYPARAARRRDRQHAPGRGGGAGGAVRHRAGRGPRRQRGAGARPGRSRPPRPRRRERPAAAAGARARPARPALRVVGRARGGIGHARRA